MHMNVSNCKMSGLLTWLSLLGLALWWRPAEVAAQCSLACQDIQVSLDEDCEVQITPDMVLVKPDSTCPGGTFTVTLSINGVPLTPPDIVNGSHIGKMVIATVEETGTGNKCWAKITVEDKLPPTIQCNADTFYCYQAYNPDLLKPTVTDNCTSTDEITLVLVDERIVPKDCDFVDSVIKVIYRDYYAVDKYGNSSAVCTDTIALKRVPFDSIKPPLNWLDSVLIFIDTFSNDTSAIRCEDFQRMEKLPSGAPHWRYTGVPTTPDGYPLFPFDAYCNLTTTFTDVYQGVVGCTEKWLRIWTIQELFCDTIRDKVITQVIHISDTTPPVITCPGDITVTTAGGNTCVGNVWLPVPQAYDSCRGNNITIDVVYPGGFIHDMKAPTLVQLPAGMHTVTYRVYDAVGTSGCYNVDSCSIKVTVLDKTPPVAVCLRNTTVSLTYDSVVRVYANVFDNGSYDDCCLDSMEVMRMDRGVPCGQNVGWRPYVEFCCADVGTTVMVNFRVWDCNGNSNTCMVEVEVQDKQPPTIVAPNDIVVPCTYKFEIDSLSKYFGTVVTNKYSRQKYTLYGPFATATDQDLGGCDLVVEVDYNVGPNKIIDVNGIYPCVNDILVHENPALNTTMFLDGYAHDNCNVVVTERFRDYRDQCGSGVIERIFTATDPANGSVSDTQYIYFYNPQPFDSTNIIYPVDQTLYNCVDPYNIDTAISGVPKFLMENECNLVGWDYEDQVFKFFNSPGEACAKVVRTWKVIDWCQRDPHGNVRIWQHQQIIKIIDRVDPVFTQLPPADTMYCSYDTLCQNGPVKMTASASDNCTPGNEMYWEYHIDFGCNGTYEVLRSGTGDTVVIDTMLPLGKHCIVFVFEDRCGNRITRTRTFSVVNCKAPSPYCKNGLVVDLMPIDRNGDGTADWGMIEVWANDFDLGSSGACGNPVVLSFSPDTTDKSRVYDCDSLGQRDVQIFVTDKITGNQSSCRTFIIVQDNNNVCPSPLQQGQVAGLITNPSGDGVQGALVDIQVSNMPTVVTDPTGKYAFPKMPLGGSYEVVPHKESRFLTGVTTRDLIVINNHILGIQTFNSPYLYIAADANEDDRVSGADIVVLRNLILGRIRKLPKGRSWRFVDKAYTFPNPHKPWNFPETYHLDPFNRDMPNVDFIGIKIGDVSGDAGANGKATGSSTRSQRTISLVVENRVLREGDEVAIDVRAAEDIQLTGLQWSAAIDNALAQFVDIVSGRIPLSEEHFAVHTNGLRMSWHDHRGLSVRKGDVLFTIHLRVRKGDVLVSDILSLDESAIAAELYDTQLKTFKLRIEYVYSQADQYALYQNVPNPFEKSTIIRFSVPEPTNAVLTIYDVNGKVVLVKEVAAEKGINAVEIKASELTSEGLLYYRLNAGHFTATRKMLFIR